MSSDRNHIFNYLEKIKNQVQGLVPSASVILETTEKLAELDLLPTQWTWSCPVDQIGVDVFIACPWLIIVIYVALDLVIKHLS